MKCFGKAIISDKTIREEEQPAKAKSNYDHTCVL